jgi:malate dehydrogenase (quinone)
MSVPHLDTRIINGHRELLFGPYAGFTTKFLKKGSYWDLAKSLELGNIFPMISAGMHNFPLTKYLIQQATQTHEDRIDALREYFPDVDPDDWELVVAGKRVQVIKSDEKEGGVLEFGTEVVFAHDGTLAALLGASPGASTSVAIMIEVLVDCFSTKVESSEWKNKLKEMIPSYGLTFHDNEELCASIRARTQKLLKLDEAVKYQAAGV